ncbi:hypothetical protein C5167_050516 [Papaver somniferum]|uniref:HD domain-containing protein n=1 Tax=Papaver somniferum TaxID=3469 RepID=A0A4Y7KQ98_PAPSO|nr:hypothetical protein C5167_050516 [Papaver somniferum]
MSESVISKAEKLVISSMKANDASHDASHALRVRDLALSLAKEEGDYKYVRDPSEEMITERFLEAENVEESKRQRILSIIKGMGTVLYKAVLHFHVISVHKGFKEELAGNQSAEFSPEFGVVQDADRLDAIGAVGIARCFTFGGSRSRVLHDPNIHPRLDLSKGQYMNKAEQTTINHFHEKLLKLKDLMKTKAGRRRAEKRHKFVEEFLTEFYEEWDGRS